MATDMRDVWPILARYRLTGTNDGWALVYLTEGGTYHQEGTSDFDLMPPRITREALADELREMAPICWGDIVAHVIDAVKSGRVE